MTDQPSQRLGKYKILDEIGRGATAVVYKARDTALDRTVAIKVMHPGLLWNPEAVERFLREARAAAQLEHPNIVIIHEVGEDQGSYYIAMQYLPGPNVAELIARGPMPIQQALDIAIQIADALAYAHERGFIHRDVKPSNIILDAREQPILTDFGLAKALEWASMTDSTGVMGTPGYIAPEIWDGEKATPATDVYGLGVVLWEMLAGRRLFEGDTPAAVMKKHLIEPSPPLGDVRPEVSGAVAKVTAQALAKMPGDRYRDAATLATALRDADRLDVLAVAEEHPPAPPVSQEPQQVADPRKPDVIHRPPPPRPPSRRKAVALSSLVTWGVAALVVLAVGAGGAWALGAFRAGSTLRTVALARLGKGPVTNLLTWIVLGGLVGWAASIVVGTRRQQGCLLDVIVGIAGAFLGGTLINLISGRGLQFSAELSSNLGNLLTAFVGAVVLLVVLRIIR